MRVKHRTNVKSRIYLEKSEYDLIQTLIFNEQNNLIDGLYRIISIPFNKDLIIIDGKSSVIHELKSILKSI